MAFGIHQLPACQGQHAADEGRSAFGKAAHGSLRGCATQVIQVAAQAAEVASALGGDGTEHGEDEAQMLNHHRRVVHTPAHHGPQCHFHKGQDHHEEQREDGRPVVQARQQRKLHAAHRGRLDDRAHWPRAARYAFKWKNTSSKVSAGTIVPRMRG